VKKSDLRVIDYIDPMLNAVEHIGRYTQGMTDSAFLVDGLVQDAVIRNLEIVGEAARNIERDHPAFAAAHRRTLGMEWGRTAIQTAPSPASLPLALQLVPPFHRREQLFVDRRIACRQPRAFRRVFRENRAVFELRADRLLLGFERGDLRRQRV
jgi:hypothetical protein